MINFLEETVSALKERGFTEDNILYIGSVSGHYYCNWDEFTKLADFEYDDGFGHVHIAYDLIIIVDGPAVFVREEYDGNERWRFVSAEVPEKPTLKALHYKDNATERPTLKYIHQKDNE